MFVAAPRDTFDGVGFGRKTGTEVGEAIRWGHFFFYRFAPRGRKEAQSTCESHRETARARRLICRAASKSEEVHNMAAKKKAIKKAVKKAVKKATKKKK